MDMRSLACFITVADTLNFRGAAQQLHLTQPALSARIQNLEDEIGTALFVRDRRHVALTAAGAALLPHARAALARISAGKEQARRAAQGETGLLRIGFTLLATYGMVPHCVREFRARYPDVHVELAEMNSPSLENALAADALDVAVLHPPLYTPGLSTASLPGERLVLALPTTHRLARRKTVAVRDLAGEPFLIAPRGVGPSIYDRVIAMFHDAGISPHIVQEVTPMTSLAALVSAGIGMGLVTAGIARLPRPDVAYRPLRPAGPVLPFALGWRGTLAPAAQRFVDSVRAWPA
ncbi:LysR family transcriptional regulator [Bordetella sp. BOR01]|uniref:LysR family transcriptional regulator n=1 Tax=Bordetella sp. BOR01 TaxID=2854779 RepID=UPI001C48A227|nr:LysR family transcriptional regulator [Bordetella sp. BOR01]MBV7485395.1 LysR family transcriptional regulator [Bordetella sp. BOR01]